MKGSITLSQFCRAVIVFACVGTQPAFATLVARYDAGVHADPTTSTGWFTWEATPSIDYQAVTDGGAPAWQISDPISVPYYYLGAGSVENLALSGWRFSMQVRVTPSTRMSVIWD